MRDRALRKRVFVGLLLSEEWQRAGNKTVQYHHSSAVSRKKKQCNELLETTPDLATALLRRTAALHLIKGMLLDR